MKGIKIIFYVFGGFALLSVVVVLLILLAQGAIIDLKYPEWTKFRNEMINAYPEIDRISYTDVGAEYCIMYYLNSSPDWDLIEDIFRKTKVFIYSEQGFDTVKNMKKGSLGAIRVEFFNKHNLKDNVKYISNCPERECIAQDFTNWIVLYRGKLLDYQEEAVP